MSFFQRFVTCISFIAVVTACGNSSPQLADPSSSASASSPALPEEPRYTTAPSVIEEDKTYDVQVWNSCGIILEVGDDWYMADRRIARRADPSVGFQPSDFGEGWDVFVFDPDVADNHAWAILDAQVTRLNDTTLEVTHQGTGDFIANFIFDPTPAEERPQCG